MTGTSATVTVTDDSFSSDVLSSSTPVLVDFWATWCGPCKMVAPVLEEIAGEKAGQLTVAKLDVDANPATARDFQVVSIPTLILFKDGAPVKRIGLRVEGKLPAREGAEIFAGTEKVGVVTSGGFAPTVGAPIAMGFVSASYAADGTALEIDVRGRRLAAVVAPMPFVPHRYVRQGGQ